MTMSPFSSWANPSFGHGGLPVRGGPHPGVTADRGEPVKITLGLFDGQLIGQGPPPALRGAVVDLFHHPFAVAGPGGRSRSCTP